MSDLRAVLEAAIAEDFDDRAAHAAYADLLAEEGDPRGELIQVQLALEEEGLPAARRSALKYREMVLYAHENEWLGPLGPVLRKYAVQTGSYGHPYRVAWSRGWVEEVELPGVYRSLTRALARCPAARFLRSLLLGYVGPDDLATEPGDNLPVEVSDSPGLYPLLSAPFLPCLRSLRVGDALDFDRPILNCTGWAEGAVELLERTPRIEEVELLSPGVDLVRLFALSLPRLRKLIVCRNDGLHPLSDLAENSGLPALETLCVFPANSFGTFLPSSEVLPFLRSPHFPALRHLHLHRSDLGDAGCTAIVGSGILKRLHTLDLRHGHIGNAGARTLARCPDLANLHHLALEHNEITQSGRQALRERLGDRASVNQQNEVGSNAYLFYDDME